MVIDGRQAEHLRQYLIVLVRGYVPARIASPDMPTGIKAFGDRLVSNNETFIPSVLVVQKSANHCYVYEKYDHEHDRNSPSRDPA
jgi:hypothetical protein